MELSVIIPVYNERRTIREILRRVCQVGIRKQIILVDDHSTDGTREILRSLEKQLGVWNKAWPQNSFVFLYQPRNRGKGAAIRAAIPMAEGHITLIQDADLEYDPANYPLLLKPIVAGKADVVYGSRFAGTNRRVLMFWHSLANRALTFLSNAFTNLNLTDIETGYKAFRTSLLKEIPIRSDRFGFEPEITAKVAKLGLRIFEVPIDYDGRTYAQGKKIGFSDAVQALFVILKYWLVDDLHSVELAGRRTLRIMEGASRYNDWLFRQCEPFLGERILEMGSGVGNITHFLLDREAVVATDIAQVHLEELERQFGGLSNLDVRRLDFNDAEAIAETAETLRLDTILSMNVLEHIQDDLMALQGCFTLLGDGGRLVLLVPAHQVLYSDLDRLIEHHRRYDLGRLRLIAEQAGFRVAEARHLNMLGALGWFVNGRILRRKLLPSRQLRLFDLAVKFLDWEKKWRPAFGLSILMICEKPAALAAARPRPEERRDRLKHPA